MSYSIARLRELSDDDLIAEHDTQAMYTVMGTDYYLEELDRRSRERSDKASARLARASFWMGAASTLLSAVAVFIALVAFLDGQ